MGLPPLAIPTLIPPAVGGDKVTGQDLAAVTQESPEFQSDRSDVFFVDDNGIGFAELV
ncbi:hypothetical protein BD309DRAFT_1024524 [Dichomitus squalens]|nr:hypothetical protein BD309DRAFT_1024524 [Dichomitus squalens]